MRPAVNNGQLVGRAKRTILARVALLCTDIEQELPRGAARLPSAGQ